MNSARITVHPADIASFKRRGWIVVSMNSNGHAVMERDSLRHDKRPKRKRG